MVRKIHDGIVERKPGDPLVRLFAIATTALIFATVFFEVVIAELHPQPFYAMGTVMSLYANFCLYLFIIAVVRKAGVTYKRSEIIVTLVVAGIAASMLIASCLTRRFIYFWDYNTYYDSTMDLFTQTGNGFIRGVINLYVSSFFDYSYFISLFTMFFFRFTTMSNNAYCASLALSCIVPVIVSASVLVKKLMLCRNIKGKKSLIVLFLSLAAIVFLPVIFFSIYRSMPDMFGLIFPFLAFTLLLDYDFSFVDKERWILLFICTVAVAAARRWYAFWAVSFWGIYGALTIICNLKGGRANIRILLRFAVKSVIAAILILAPMVVRFVISNYSTGYASWKNDTYPQNQLRYFSYLGYGIVAVILAGNLICLFRKKERIFGITTLCCLFVPLMLFHRIQTADYHQLLILAPSVCFLIVYFIVNAAAVKYGILLSCLVVVLSLLNWVNAFTHRLNSLLPVVSSADLVIPERDDIEMIEEINRWIIENCDNEDNKVYMVPHNGNYCPDMFQYHALPDRRVMELLPYGSDVLSAHSFPTELLDGRYIITCSPLGQEGNSMAPCIDRAVSRLYSEGVFEINTTFDMGNGYTFIVYERVQDVTEHEKDIYKEELAGAIAEYPDHYTVLFE